MTYAASSLPYEGHIQKSITILKLVKDLVWEVFATNLS